MTAALVHTAASRQATRPSPAFGTPDFAALLGPGAWASLPAAVRARFDHAAERCTRLYPGTITVRANLAGRLLAQACRLIGTPFALWTGEDVPVSVRVAPAAGGGLVWERTYAFADRPPVRVASRKLAEPNGELLELIDCGLGMRLKLSVEGGDLVFADAGYVWRLGPWLVPLPRFLTPGHSLMVHRDLGGGRFLFLMTFTHPLAGELFFQSGVFEDPAS